MKILIIGVGYQCPNLENVLKPWIEAQKSHNIDIVVSAALFKERQENGEVFDNTQNRDYLLSISSIKYIETSDPILDFESRNNVLRVVDKRDYDYFWQLDIFDEYYSLDEINNTIDYLNNDGLSSYYRVNFKNYFGKVEDKTFVLDFKPVRIINNRVHGGVDRFYWDNDAQFNESLGTKTPFTSGETIPKKICHPKHLSWVGIKEFLKAKIDYQHRAIKCCSYKWDEEKDCLTFDLDYYKRFNLTPPQVFRD